MFLIPFISALADAGGIIVDKLVLARRRMAIHVFIPTLFLVLFAISALLVPLLGRVNLELALRTDYLFYFVIMVVLAIAWNIFYYQSIQKEELWEHELIIMLTPAVTIMLASVFFPEKFDLRIFAASLIAAIALFVTKLEKHHFVFDKYSINLMLAVFLMALEVIVMNELLQGGVYSPVSLYAFRTGFVFLFFLGYYRPHLSAVCKTNIGWIALSGLLGVIFMILRLYGYKYLGIVHTTLVLIISPLIVHVASSMIFRERLKLKTIISGLVILVSILYVTYIDWIR